MTIGERIKESRRNSGFSQSKLAEAVNTSQAAVALWESGKYLPTAENIVSLCDILNCSSDYLLGMTDKKIETV